MEHDSPLYRAMIERGFILVAEQGGLGSHWTHPHAELNELYQQLTAAGAEASMSFFFIDHYLEHIRPKHLAILLRLRAIARHGFNPNPSLARLGASIRMSEDAAREFVRWWEQYRPDDVEWRIMRAYVRDIRPGAGRTYVFNVVLNDVLDYATLALFDRQAEQILLMTPATLAADAAANPGMGSEKQTGGDPELPLELGEDGDPSAFPTPQTGKQLNMPLSTPEKQTGSAASRPMGSEKPTPSPAMAGDPSAFATPSPGTTPANPGMGSEKQTGGDPESPPLPPSRTLPPIPPSSAREAGWLSGEESENEYPAEEQASQLLEAAGVRPGSIRWILTQPKGAYWAVRWLVWRKFAGEIRSPRGFLFDRIKAAILGDEDARAAPGEYLDHLEARARDRKSRARTASVLADRPDPYAEQKRAAAGKSAPPSQPVAAEFATFWSSIQAVAAAVKVTMALTGARPVAFDGEELVIELAAPIHLDALARRRCALLNRLRDADPQFPELKFIAKGAQA